MYVELLTEQINKWNEINSFALHGNTSRDITCIFQVGHGQVTLKRFSLTKYTERTEFFITIKIPNLIVFKAGLSLKDVNEIEAFEKVAERTVKEILLNGFNNAIVVSNNLQRLY